MSAGTPPTDSRPAARPRFAAGFSLIEMLIVIALLAVLAALVAPRYANVSEQSGDSAVRSQLQRVRVQIELYRAERGDYPDLVASQWVDLVDGGFLRVPPGNPLNGNRAVAAAPGPGVGWVWRDEGDGSFQIFATDDTALGEFAE